MNTAEAALNGWDGTIVDRRDRRGMLDEPSHATHAAAAHAARIGHTDKEILLALLNRDRDDHVLSGPPSDAYAGQTRKFVAADVQKIIRSDLFKSLLRARRDELRKDRARLIEVKRAQDEEAARIAAEVAREKQASPHLWAMVEDLRVQIAELQGPPIIREGMRSPLLRN